MFAQLRVEKTPQLIASAHHGFQTQWALDNPGKKSNYDKIQYDQSRQVAALAQSDAIPGEWMWSHYVAPNLSNMTNRGSAILSSGKVGGSGHDVAFHALGGSYYFFEPNFGEYHFKESHPLQELFCGTWDCVYRARGYNWAFWASYLRTDS